MSVSLLVDTHLVIWIRSKPQEISVGERAALDGASRRFVSIVTLWEIAVLQNVGRLPKDPRLLSPPRGFEMLAIEAAHCEAYAGLPLLHRDPFDRMLIAQARIENITLLTRDTQIVQYGRNGCATMMASPATR